MSSRIKQFVATNRDLPDHIAEKLLEQYNAVPYVKNSIIFLEGSPAHFLFGIISGFVKLYQTEANGTRCLVRLAGPGDLLGITNHFDQKGLLVATFEAHAATKCELALVTQDHVASVMRSLNADDMLRLIDFLNLRCSSERSRSARFMVLSYRGRLEVILKELAARFGVRESRGSIIIPELGHSDLAEMIGSSRPMVTRLISAMIQEGEIARQGKRYILLSPCSFAFSDTLQPI